jgi:cytochrome c-type biogenesis protein CcmH
MMLLWLVSGLLVVIALALLLRPLLRQRAPELGRATYDVAIYRDQLDEIARDVARGVLGDAEAAAARLEIERRLLASQPRGPADVSRLSPFSLRLGAAAIVLAVPAIAVSLYLRLGAPGLPDAPLAGRQEERKVLASDGSLNLTRARQEIEAKLQIAPDNVRGWFLLAHTDASLRDWPAAHKAFDKVLELSQRAPDMLDDYGNMLITEANGDVTAEAAAVLEEARKTRPDLFRANYYLALAKAQRGDMPGALADWRAMIAGAPPDANWVDTVKSVIAEAEQQASGSEAAPVPAASDAKPPPEMAAILQLPPADRVSAIRSMVAGLAARLETDPNDLEGWKRLARSYRVLGDPQKSAEAYAKAAALAPDDMALLVGEADALQATRPNGTSVTPDVTALYQKVVEQQPDQPKALWYLGLAEKQAGHGDAASSFWQRLLSQLKPDSAEAKTVQEQLAGLAAGKE